MGRESGCPDIDDEAEIVKPRDEALRTLGLVPAVEMIGAEVARVDTVVEHVVGGGQHGGRHRQHGLLGSPSALDAQERSAEIAVVLAGGRPGGLHEGVLSHGLLERVRLDRRLPALS